jgi:hypothetical protein
MVTVLKLSNHSIAQFFYALILEILKSNKNLKCTLEVPESFIASYLIKNKA